MGRGGWVGVGACDAGGVGGVVGARQGGTVLDGRAGGWVVVGGLPWGGCVLARHGARPSCWGCRPCRSLVRPAGMLRCPPACLPSSPPGACAAACCRPCCPASRPPPHPPPLLPAVEISVTKDAVKFGTTGDIGSANIMCRWGGGPGVGGEVDRAWRKGEVWVRWGRAWDQSRDAGVLAAALVGGWAAPPLRACPPGGPAEAGMAVPHPCPLVFRPPGCRLPRPPTTFLLFFCLSLLLLQAEQERGQARGEHRD